MARIKAPLLARQSITQLVNAAGDRPDLLILIPLIAWCEEGGSKGYGRKTAIARAMSKLSGHSITRDMVRCWLHPKESKRRQPSFYYGLLLIAAAEQVVRSFNEKKHGNHSRTNTKKRLR